MSSIDPGTSKSSTTTTPEPGAGSTNGKLKPSGGDTPPPRGGKGGRLLGIAMLAALMGFAGGVGGYAVAERSDTTDTKAVAEPQPDTSSAAPSNPTDKQADSTEPASEGVLTPRQIYRQAGPAVVHVTSKVSVTDTSFFGVPQEREGTGSGSGFVVDDEGHIVTNAHVVEGATKVFVSFSDEKEIEARVIGTDISTDLAVLKVDPDTEALKNALKPVTYADSSKVQVGDPVVAIGNPFNLDRTLTTGVVSALQRQIRAQNGFAIDDVIQTDAAINPGNSGGPLLNMRGEVIGVTSQIQSRSGGNDGIGFAVPSNTVKRIASQLLDTGVVKHAWLGVAGTDIDKSISDLLKLPTNEGVLVGQVTPGSPADKAGIKGGDRAVVIDGQNFQLGGDVIVSIDGRKLTTMAKLADAINSRKPGDKVKLEYFHDDKRKTTTITLGSRPDELDNTER